MTTPASERMVDLRVPSAAVGGAIEVTVVLPEDYGDTDEAFPTLYLLHGRGGDRHECLALADDVDAVVAHGDMPPVIVVVPDAPWSLRASYYVDSRYGGSATVPPGVAVETAFTTDLLGEIDGRFRTIPSRSGRTIGGYSMGGAGALRFVLAHPDLFAAALVLSPAVYTPLPPDESTTRLFGAYGVDDRLFDADRFARLSYPAAVAAIDDALPVRIFLAAGRDESAEEPSQFRLLADTLSTAEVLTDSRLLPGGHDWAVWHPAARGGLEWLNSSP